MDYIGTKMVRAWPMSRGEYNAYRGWTVPDNEDPNDYGYLVEYQDGGKPNDTRHAGYISWSPADVFERAYRRTTGLTFGQALEAMKAGQRVARKGWNGKGMYLAVQPGSTIAPAQARGGVAKYRANEGVPEIVILPHIDMRAADGAVVVGWLASQTDMLSDDWVVL